MASFGKILGQSNPNATTLTDLYTVSAPAAVVSELIVCNRSGTATSFRLSLAQAGATDANSQYIFYDTAISGNQTVAYSINLPLTNSDKVRCYATLATLTFTILGTELT